jgi:hypothetical protein
MRKILIALAVSFFTLSAQAQEMRCKAIVNANQIQGVDRKVFKTLEQGIETFVNSRKWTNDAFESNEKIDVVFSIVLSKKIEGVEGGFAGNISIQASRPVFNTDYASSTVNYVDKNFAIKYIQFQPLDFNDNNVSGSDALASNLTAVIAYYTYLIIGLDYDSFSSKGGTTYFNKALNVVNNSPENRYISGWKASESKRRNRYWLIDQILNNRFTKFRTSFYTYHRLGLDNMITDPAKARKNINKIFYDLKRINQENPSSVLLQFFFNAKSEELMDFIKNADRAEKELIIPICSSIDVRNAQRYFKLMR